MNEGILSGKSVSTGGSDDGIGDAVHTRDRDERGLSVKRLPRTHVGHNLVAHLDEIVGRSLGRNLCEAEIGFRIDQSGIDRHSGDVHDLRTARDANRGRRTDSRDLPTLQDDRTVLNHAVRDSQQLSAFEHKRLVLGRGCSRPWKNCHSEERNDEKSAFRRKLRTEN